MKVKNWEKFQHYKNRRPPWIKLYRELLDDPQFFALSGDAVKALIMIWLIASEDDGNLPDSETLAWRLRVDSKALDSSLSELKHYIASDTLALCYQDAIPERETEEIRKEKNNVRLNYSDQFDGLWKIYGMHGNKKAAYAQFQKLSEEDKDRLAESLKPYLKENPEKRYRKHFERYLRDRVFDDVLERQAAGISQNSEPLHLGGWGQSEPQVVVADDESIDDIQF